jgi:hypothetical protein
MNGQRLFLIINSIDFYWLMNLMNIAEFAQVMPGSGICNLVNRNNMN